MWHAVFMTDMTPSEVRAAQNLWQRILPARTNPDSPMLQDCLDLGRLIERVAQCAEKSWVDVPLGGTVVLTGGGFRGLVEEAVLRGDLHIQALKNAPIERKAPGVGRILMQQIQIGREFMGDMDFKIPEASRMVVTLYERLHDTVEDRLAADTLSPRIAEDFARMGYEMMMALDETPGFSPDLHDLNARRVMGKALYDRLYGIWFGDIDHEAEEEVALVRKAREWTKPNEHPALHDLCDIIQDVHVAEATARQTVAYSGGWGTLPGLSSPRP